jgi:uncharacterized membrane protein
VANIRYIWTTQGGFVLKKWVFGLLAFFIMLTTNGYAAHDGDIPPIQYEKGVVISVSPIDVSMQKQYFKQKGDLVTLKMTSGPDSGKEIDTFNFQDERSPFNIRVAAGDKVIVAVTQDMGRINYSVADFDRFDYVYALLALFVGCLILFAGIVGIRSVFVIGFSTFLIFKFYISQVLAGQSDLTLLTLGICSVIAVVTQVSISGFNRKSLAAILGTVGGVAIAGVLSTVTIALMHLSGLDSEAAMVLKAARLSTVNFQGVLFSGMVFGALGAVMDVTVSIASALYEVKAAQPEMGMKELFMTGMNVGRDIMGIMSNTLILAYAGSALPLVLLIASQSDISMLKVMNLNIIVTEIARALTGSVGLICAIPLTALISAFLLRATPDFVEK